MVRLLLLLLALGSLASAQTHNLTVSSANSSITYTPFRCQEDEACDGGWQPTGAVMTTLGRGSGEIIPQMIMRVHASAIFLTTSPSSNATMNVTVFQRSITVRETFLPPILTVSIVNLVEREETIFSVTYVEGGRLDIGDIMLTIADESATAFPTMTLAPSIVAPLTPTTLPIPSSTESEATRPSNRKRLALILGLVLGLGLGLSALLLCVFLVLRSRKKSAKPSLRNRFFALETRPR